ncbi:MAG: hypothetical protein L6R36_005512 [Xanthoria steineri]|nr:MAG: hypothetical protein L6R36_005512 [Xanthoria steineri]
MGQSVLRVVPFVRGLSHSQPACGVSVRALHAASCTARSRLFGPAGFSAPRVGYLDYLQPESSLYPKIIKLSPFRAYTSDAKKEAETDTADSRQKWSHPPGCRAERASEEPSVVGLGAQGITVLAILYACFMDTTIRDPNGNAIATLNPFSYMRCRVFLQGERSLHEYARAQVVEQEAERERSKERKEKEEKAEKRAEETREKFEEEERMIRMEEKEKIRVSIPKSIVQQFIAATTKEEWDSLQKDAKALVAAEVERQSAEQWKERYLDLQERHVQMMLNGVRYP